MKKYEKALHDWFFKNSGIPSTSPYSDGYVDSATTRKLHEHLEDVGCELIWTQEPEFDKEDVWGGTFNPNMTISVIDAKVSCTCPEDGYRYTTLRYNGNEDTLSGMILAVLAEGDKED